MENYHNRISRYFRQSLIDSDRLCPDDKDILNILGKDKQQDPEGDYLALSVQYWQQGFVDVDLAEKVIKARQPKNKPPIQQLEIVIFPRVDHLAYIGGDSDKRKRKVMLPLVVFANLQRDGRLLPTNKAPWIPRICIGPTQSATQPFTEMAMLDKFFTQHPFEGIESWSQLISYCTRLLCEVTGKAYYEASEDQPATQLSDVMLTEEYERSSQCLLQLGKPVVGAKESLISTLDFMIDKKSYPKLYKSYCSRNSVNLRLYQDVQDSVGLAKQHVGQMSGEFPLSVKQRNALHRFVDQKEGEILAINGPPGTGKTTLLRSVVANLWTQAALNQSDPPLIVATSNNNQAVTNILESFAKIDEDGLDEALIGRWLPEVDSYGLFFCAKSKANQKNKFRYSGPAGEGCMQAWQTSDFIDEAEEFFLEKISVWQKKKYDCIEKSRKCLHEEMQRVKGKIQQGFDCLSMYELALRDIEKPHGSIEKLQDVIAQLKNAVSEKGESHLKEKGLLDKLYELWGARSLWVTLLIWLPHVKKQEERKTARLLNESDRILDNFQDDEVEKKITQTMRSIQHDIEQSEKELQSAEDLLLSFEKQQNDLNSWLNPVNFLFFEKDLAAKVVELNDRYYRFQLFKLATHYFEASWLIETKTFIENKDEDKKSPYKLLRKLRRYAKLTPCFVSTFYMVPKTFTAGEYKDDVWCHLPQLEEIDLLIIDEAGQALPDVSAASFALAKSALIVGDTDQIEPVWTIPVSIDRSNLALFDLLAGEKGYEQWLDSGLLASSGNVMKVAQRQCHYHQFEKLQRGLYLTEHRRCFNSIIDYCNVLVYNGVLEPLRGNTDHEVPWGTMSMLPVSSPSKPFGGSRVNSGEAKMIAQWINEQMQSLIAYAREQDSKYIDMYDAEVLFKSVAVVTPFSKQASLIKSTLKQVGIDGLTVGTVHSLQGGERLVVLFSSVYGDNDKEKSKFYDAGSNMLNVAVSRAKNSFIVFGNPDVFGMNVMGTPSALLRPRLKMLEAPFR